jgi:DNA-binding response OmpR family regulator
MLPNMSPSPAPPLQLLYVDADQVAAKYAPVLRESYRVLVASTVEGALQCVARAAPALIVTELELGSRSGVEVCRAAKAAAVPATVLVTTTDVERVPEALTAGCDGVLLKPFAPNLLYARIGRLLRERSMELRLRARQHYAKSAHLSERANLLISGTNRVWPNTHCPYCQHPGATSFEFSSHRRAWYACLECRKVWLAKRQE